MRKFYVWGILLTVFGLLGCSDENPASSPAGVDDEAAAKVVPSAYPAGDAQVRMMTRNLFLGTDINPILAGAPTEIPVLMAQGWATVLANDFPARAQALADEIAQAQPHLVGLQEVALFRIQSPGDVLQGNPVPAQTVALDYLEILLAELDLRGMSYRPVAITTGIDIELPMATHLPLDDLRYTDREVILARADVRVSNPQGQNYTTSITVPVAGAQVKIVRGWASVDTRITGQTLRFVSTHLEMQKFAPIQVAQAAELAAMVAGQPLPVVVVGDFNSAADGSQTTTYGNLAAAGLVDVWGVANPDELGYTCCHPDDLHDPASLFNRRIDLIWVKPVETQSKIRKAAAGVVGEELADRTPSGLWPADHAGVWASFRLHPVPQAGR